MHHASSPASSGRLLGRLAWGFYALFTLLPDSHSLMVAWPWVLFWQVGLTLPVVWLLWQIWQQGSVYPLGHWLDGCAGGGAIVLVISTLGAEFPNQARWYSWAALCLVIAIYGIHQWIRADSRQSQMKSLALLTLQGYLAMAFILESLGLWITQTWLPELQKLRAFESMGVTIAFDLTRLELRNWAPIGHQNYVAGYLLLAIPLLLGLTLIHTGWPRWFWATGVALGICDLYTTNSRSGWLGLVGMIVIYTGIWLWRHQRWWLGLELLPLLLSLVLVNDRIRLGIWGLFNGQTNSELTFRVINGSIGWHIGLDHLWTGAGLGSIPLLYQRYRPAWAGREAELVYQLHSTPVQVWAELGLWGMAVMATTLGLVLIRSSRWWPLFDQANPLKPSPSHYPSDWILIVSLPAALLAYGILALMDYQLDNVGISGTIVIYLAVLAGSFSGTWPNQGSIPDALGSDVESASPPLLPAPLPRRFLGFGLLAAVAILLAIAIWLVPIHRAWQRSHQGFLALSRQDQDIPNFVQNLEQAHRWAPWEPYYLNQLGWNLGNLGLELGNPQMIQAAQDWFRQSIAVSPYQDFAYTNLGWLQLKQDPEQALGSFAQAATLVPAKRGVFYGLGLSLLQQNNQAGAIAALTLESLRDPQFLTSPLWRTAALAPLYPKVVQQTQERWQQLLQSTPASSPLARYLHQQLGGVAWLQSDWDKAADEFMAGNSILGQRLVAIATDQPVTLQDETSAAALIMLAWLQPPNREQWLTQAWITATQTLPPSGMIVALTSTINQSASFQQWLTKTAPTRQYRPERLGFGVLSRHVDGPLPQDFLVIDEFIPLVLLASDLFHNPTYLHDFDRKLQPLRTEFLQQVLPKK